MKAVMLFGGVHTLKRRINESVKDALCEIDDETELRYLEEAFFLKKGTLEKIRRDKLRVGIRLFDRLSVPLKLTYSETFGPPQLENKKTRQQWDEHKKNNWINGGAKATLATNLDIALEFYVTLMAATEMRRASK